jgi:hypothetical protein
VRYQARETMTGVFAGIQSRLLGDQPSNMTLRTVLVRGCTWLGRWPRKRSRCEAVRAFFAIASPSSGLAQRDGPSSYVQAAGARRKETKAWKGKGRKGQGEPDREGGRQK